MYPIGQILGPVIGSTSGGSSSGNLDENILIESFVYNGVDNEFDLANNASKVLDVYIDNGTYPDQVPNGAVSSVTVDAGLMLPDNTITIKYIKA